MPQHTENDSLESDLKNEEKLLSHAGDAVHHSVNYLLSRASLAVTEAKVAAVSLILVLILAICAVIILCATWALLCYTLAHWLTSALALSVPLAFLGVALVNILLLVIIAFCARNLVTNLNLIDALRPAEITTEEGSS